MKNYFLLLLFIVFEPVLIGQTLFETREGKVSYITTQYVYVKFQSTEKINPGDTLFINQDDNMIPVVTVKDISSISCVCTPVSTKKLAVGDQVFSRQKKLNPVSPANKTETQLPVASPNVDSSSYRKLPASKYKQVVRGNLSAASFLNFSNVTSNSQRMQYTFSMVAQYLGNSKLSLETYLVFAHKLGEWSTIQHDLFNGLKIYSLAINYEFNKYNFLWVGRKINPRISSGGAIDGIQYEFKPGTFTIGLFAGTRPDYRDYSFNMNLVQAGAYLGHDLPNKNGSMQTTIAFMEQTNSSKTDRRFAYIQYSNSLVKNLFLFGSIEVDMYKKTMVPKDTAVSKDTTYKQDNSPRVSNLYLSLRYRPIRQLSLSFSYSNRQNVIYYQTYKNIVDRLLEAATVQGFMFQINYQPAKYLSFGVSSGYRSSRQDPRPAKNLYGYLTFSHIPGINIATTLSATILETSYISGKIYSLGISRDLVPGILSGGVDWRYVSYNSFTDEPKLIQNMAEFNFIWRIFRKLSMGIYYEGEFDKKSTFNRVYLNLTQRF